MKKTTKKIKSDLLLQKISDLESKVKESNQLLKKYKKALQDSNTRIKKISDKLVQSLSLAQTINKHLIPIELPYISGFEMSCKFIPTQKGVSGDFFDVIKIKDSMKFGILLSNCNTYSLTSLFLSSFLKSAPASKSYKTSQSFLSQVAKTMQHSAQKDETIHLFYGIISRSSFEMDYCLVGDIFAGRFREDKTFSIFNPCAKNLLKSPLKLKSERLTLKPKDVLLFCSPGVRHTKNKKGDSFGDKNIIQSALKDVSKDVLGIRQNILFNCNQFSKQTHNLQDRTILVVKAQEKALRLSKP